MNEVQTGQRPSLEVRIAALRPGLEVLSLPACILDAHMRYAYVNAAYSAFTGRPAAEFIGHTPDEVFELRPTDGRRSNVLRALEGEPVVFNRQTLEGPNAGRWVR